MLLALKDGYKFLSGASSIGSAHLAVLAAPGGPTSPSPGPQGCWILEGKRRNLLFLAAEACGAQSLDNKACFWLIPTSYKSTWCFSVCYLS